MKTANLTRNEAYKAMIDGQKVSHPYCRSLYIYLSDIGDGVLHPYFKSFDGDRWGVVRDLMSPKDGYFIYEPEPTFKEVTMYAPVYKNAFADAIYQSKEQAFSRLGAIGYAEVKVYLKESEGEDE